MALQKFLQAPTFQLLPFGEIMMEIKFLLRKTSMKKRSKLSIGDKTYDFLEIDNRKIFITHYPELAEPMAKSGEFDAVFYGHNHDKKMEKVNNCLVLNPGEISAHKTGVASFAIYDSDKNTAEIIKLENIITLKTDKTKKIYKKLKINLELFLKTL